MTLPGREGTRRGGERRHGSVVAADAPGLTAAEVFLHAPGVHLLFVDESGRPEDKTFAVGGVVVQADQWSVVRDRWQQALAEHHWPPDKEIKWHGTALARCPNACRLRLRRPRRLPPHLLGAMGGARLERATSCV